MKLTDPEKAKVLESRRIATIGRQRMQILKLKAFVLSVSVITEHRCPSCDAIDVVTEALKDLEIHEREESNASSQG